MLFCGIKPLSGSVKVALGGHKKGPPLVGLEEECAELTVPGVTDSSDWSSGGFDARATVVRVARLVLRL